MQLPKIKINRLYFFCSFITFHFQKSCVCKPNFFLQIKHIKYETYFLVQKWHFEKEIKNDLGDFYGK